MFPVPCCSGPWLGSSGGGHSSPSLLRQRIPSPPSSGGCFPFACVAATCSVSPSCGRLPPPAFTRSVFLHAVWSSCSTASTVMAFDLDRSQQSAWESYLAGKNVGLFGRAGCGKSAVLKRAIAHARRVHGAERVDVMAWTTAAAKMIDGRTLHKFLRVGIAELPKDRVLDSVKNNRFVHRSVANTAVIFIDELPLIPTRWLTILEYVVRQLGPDSKHGRPWGRCQVVGKFSSAFLNVSGWKERSGLVMCRAEDCEAGTIRCDASSLFLCHCTDTVLCNTHDVSLLLFFSVQLPVTLYSLALFKASATTWMRQCTVVGRFETPSSPATALSFF